MSNGKLTPWAQRGVAPFHEGVYQVRSYEWSGFAYWSKSHGWGGGKQSLSGAYEERYNGGMHDFFHTGSASWRGLASDPKAKP